MKYIAMFFSVIFLNISNAVLFLSQSDIGTTMNIVVGIAEKKIDCGVNEIGYQVFYGTKTISALTKKAKAMKDKTNSDGIRILKNIHHNGISKGNWLAIVTTQKKDNSGCYRNAYGVGFSNEKKNAKKKAIVNIKKKNPNINDDDIKASEIKIKKYKI